MVDEALCSGPGLDEPTAVLSCAAVPHGFSVLRTPAGRTGHWHDAVGLGDGRTGVLVGCGADRNGTGLMRSAARDALIHTADPVRSLSGLTGTDIAALCAVIDGSTIAYSSRGRGGACGPGGAVTDRESGPHPLADAEGRLVVAPLRPGVTVLMWSGQIGEAAAALEGCEFESPQQVAARVLARLSGADSARVAAVLYRHPPQPLTATLPADPASLAISRGLLRNWLDEAAVDPESQADLLLAAGEATANATEHAVVGAVAEVSITVTAALTGGRVRLEVSDTGVWKPAAVDPGHRGHGLHLIHAVVDTAELTTTPEGTTVLMFRELRR